MKKLADRESEEYERTNRKVRVELRKSTVLTRPTRQIETG